MTLNVRQLPVTSVAFDTSDKEPTFHVHMEDIAVYEPGTWNIKPWPEIKDKFPDGVIVAKAIDVDGKWDATTLSLSWKTDFGTSDACTLQKVQS